MSHDFNKFIYLFFLQLAESLAYDVVTQGTQKVTRADAERW
jgi:hypothetical protein